jgi:hypothetical protein
MPTQTTEGQLTKRPSLEVRWRMLVVSSDLRALVVFFVPVLGVQLVVWTNIRFVRSHIRNWNSHSTFLFVISLGQFRQKQRELWRCRGDYDETEANIIIKYQFLCLLEILLGFIAGILVDHYFLHS